MFQDRLTIVAFCVSLGVHALVLGGVDGWRFSLSPEKEAPETTHLQIEKEKYALLPEIKVIGEIKRLQDNKEQKKQDQQSDYEISQQEAIFEDPVEKEIKALDAAQEAMLRYQDMVKQKIESHRQYPSWAQRRKIEGAVGLKFVILPNGQAEEIKVISSSGHEILDKESQDTIRRASPFLAIPDEISQGSVIIQLAIVFSID